MSYRLPVYPSSRLAVQSYIRRHADDCVLRAVPGRAQRAGDGPRPVPRARGSRRRRRSRLPGSPGGASRSQAVLGRMLRAAAPRGTQARRPAAGRGCAGAVRRLGVRTRALLALDRAFALEPHTETLRLRGRILRDAGRYQAAEVAYEGAAQAAEHAEQRQGAEREIAITRRYAFYAPRRPEDLSPAERWFAETGTVVLAPDPGADVPDDAALVTAFLDLARDSRWRFGQVVALGPALPAWQALADGLGAPLVGRAGFDAAAVPLVVAQRALSGDAGWSALQAAVARDGTGLVFVLEHAVDDTAPAPGAADVIGVLSDAGRRRARRINVAHALSEAQHPAARLAGRRLVRE